uniref:Uncharacterized protein n=1 Tax=Anopheles albimanus TaxID=7167 RepID=A0A182FMF0_ANOAL
MNPISLYITISRLVFKSDLPSELQDLNRLLPYLRKSLSCVVCCKLLVEPQSPSAAGCQHHVCRKCIGKRKKLKPACRFCKDAPQYTGNMQLRIVLQGYKKICLYIRGHSVFADIKKCAMEQMGGVAGGRTGHTNNHGASPNSLMDLIDEGADFEDDFECNSGLTKAAYSILPCIFPVPVVRKRTNAGKIKKALHGGQKSGDGRVASATRKCFSQALQQEYQKQSSEREHSRQQRNLQQHPLIIQPTIRRVIASSRAGPTIIHAKLPPTRTPAISANGSSIVPTNLLQPGGSSAAAPIVKNACPPTTPRIVNITTPQEIKYQSAPIKTVSNGSTMYSVVYASNSNKVSVKRKSDVPITKATSAFPLKIAATTMQSLQQHKPTSNPPIDQQAKIVQQPLAASLPLASPSQLPKTNTPNQPVVAQQLQQQQRPAQLQVRSQQPIPAQHSQQQALVASKQVLQRTVPSQFTADRVNVAPRAQHVVFQQASRQQQGQPQQLKVLNQSLGQLQQQPKLIQLQGSVTQQPPQQLQLQGQHQLPQQPQLLQKKLLLHAGSQKSPQGQHQPQQVQQQPQQQQVVLLQQQSQPQPQPQTQQTQQQQQQLLQQQSIKRKGCRCGNATPTPGKLTCCGQRCPCYVDSKSCVDCKCRGCRNPHRADGLKIRRSLSELLQQYNTPTSVEGDVKDGTKLVLSGMGANVSSGPSGSNLITGPKIAPITYSMTAAKMKQEAVVSAGSGNVKVINAGQHLQISKTPAAEVTSVAASSVANTICTPQTVMYKAGKPLVNRFLPTMQPLPVATASTSLASDTSASVRPFVGGFVNGNSTTTVSYLPVAATSALSTSTASSSATMLSSGSGSTSTVNTGLFFGVDNARSLSLSVSTPATTTATGQYGRLWARPNDTKQTVPTFAGSVTIADGGAGPSKTNAQGGTLAPQIRACSVSKPDAMLGQTSSQPSLSSSTNFASNPRSSPSATRFGSDSSSLAYCSPISSTTDSSLMMLNAAAASSNLSTNNNLVFLNPSHGLPSDLANLTGYDVILDSDGGLDLCQDLELNAANLMTFD